ncbi:hypothetical protein ACLB2K_016834 [Fragaria x ananassa]
MGESVRASWRDSLMDESVCASWRDSHWWASKSALVGVTLEWQAAAGRSALVGETLERRAAAGRVSPRWLARLSRRDGPLMVESVRANCVTLEWQAAAGRVSPRWLARLSWLGGPLIWDNWRGEFVLSKLKIGRAAICVLGFPQFYSLQTGKRPISSSIEWVRALGCLQPASLPPRGSTVSRYEFVCGGGIVHMFVMVGILG